MPATETKASKNMKRCQFCDELIRYHAVKCRFCGEFLYGDRQHSIPEPDEEYVEETQDETETDDEEILYWGRPSVFALSKTIVVGIVLLALAIGIMIYPAANLLEQIPNLNLSEAEIISIENHAHNAGIVMIALVLLILIAKIAQLKSICYEVNVDRIEWARGLLSRQIDNIDMFRVIDLKLHRSIFDCIVGVGTVTLTTKDESDPEFEFLKVRRCRYLYDVVKKASLDADRKQGVIHIE